MKFQGFSITKFHKVPQSLYFEILWNILDTTLKFQICQKCYEISLKINEISLKL